MHDGPTPTEIEHLDLLEISRAVQDAAVADDVDTVHDELCRFRNALVAHLGRDHPHLVDPDLHARLTRHGHERLLSFLDRLLEDTSDSGPDGCACVVRAAELRAMLVRQIRLEAGMRATRW